MKELSIGILYIAIGKYEVFWEDFYESLEQFFVPSYRKNYYVFTDSETIKHSEKENVFIIKTADRGWPLNTLLRFSMFESIAGNLVENDYLFFFNANLVCVDTITEEFLPKDKNLLVAVHPGYINAEEAKKPFCRNKKSTAFVPFGTDAIYVQGALNGGKTSHFLAMIKKLAENVRIDYSKGIVANVHDESHLNRYIIGRNDVKYVGPEYIFPEGYDLKADKIFILSRDKSRYFDVDKVKMSFFEYFVNKLALIVKGAFLWMRKK